MSGPLPLPSERRSVSTKCGIRSCHEQTLHVKGWCWNCRPYQIDTYHRPLTTARSMHTYSQQKAALTRATQGAPA